MCPVAPPLRFNGQTERLSRIPETLEEYEASDSGVAVDVFCVQESIIKSQHMLLSRGLKKMGFSYETPQIVGKMLDGKLVQGGVVIMSRHPILKYHVHAFTSECGCDGADCLAAKGFSYAKINVRGHIVHVVSTHFQAWNRGDTFEIRVRQANEVAEYLESLRLTAGPEEPIFLAGDFNVDQYTQPTHLSRLCEIMCNFQTVPLRHSYSEIYSSDPGTNRLMGNDEDSAYASAEWPEGCYPEYLKEGRCPCCPAELLDYTGYIVPSTGFKPVEETTWSAVIPLKAAQPFRMNITASTRREMRDLSDHYPRIVSYDLNVSTNGDETTREGSRVDAETKADAFSVIWTILMLVLAACLTGVVFIALTKQQ